MTLKTALTGIAAGFASAIILASAVHAAPNDNRSDRDLSAYSHRPDNNHVTQYGDYDRPGYHRSPQPDYNGYTNGYDPRNPYYGQNTRYPGYTGSHSGYGQPTYPPQHYGQQNPRSVYGDLVIFEHGDYRGQSAPLNGNIARLNDIRFNDRISSIIVNRGTWEVCTDAYFRGRCYVVDRSISSLGRVGINDKISSIRRVNSGYHGRR